MKKLFFVGVAFLVALLAILFADCKKWAKYNRYAYLTWH